MQEELDFSVPTHTLHRAGQSTSRKALVKTEKSRDNRQRRVFEFLKKFPTGNIPEEISALMGEDLIDVRRCFSVLKKLGKIEATGEERENGKGNFCMVWKVAHVD
jgi:hypothetical protein